MPRRSGLQRCSLRLAASAVYPRGAQRARLLQHMADLWEEDMDAVELVDLLPGEDLEGVDINQEVRANGAVIAEHRAQLAAQGFSFCDADPQAPAQQRLHELSHDCVNLIEEAVCASSEDHRDQAAGVLPWEPKLAETRPVPSRPHNGISLCRRCN